MTPSTFISPFTLAQNLLCLSSMTTLSSPEKLSPWERVKQAIFESSENESSKPFKERLKEEATIPFHLYKGAVQGGLKLLESGSGFNGIKTSLQDLHQISTDRTQFEQNKKQQKEAFIEFGKESLQYGKEFYQDYRKKLHELWDGVTHTASQKAVDFIKLSRKEQAEIVGGLAPDVVLSMSGVEEVVRSIKSARLVSQLIRDEKGAISKIPLAFSKPKNFAQFVQTFKSGLEEAGFPDTQLLFRGSSVTGKSFTTGEVFSLARGSDVDIALAGREIFEGAKGLKIPLRGKGTRTMPLSQRQVFKLGLDPLLQKLQSQTPYPVKLMIYDSVEDVTSRGAHILLW